MIFLFSISIFDFDLRLCFFFYFDYSQWFDKILEAFSFIYLRM